jgi:hypothetical protein
MEFKEFGPLEQSKEIAENKKATWGTVILLISASVLFGVIYGKMISRQNWENQFRMNDKS